MKRSSRVFGTPVYLNGSPSMSLNGDNNIEVVDGNGSSVECVAFNVENTSVNRVEINATATGNSPGIEVTGTDADINILLSPKGTGVTEMTTDLKIAGTDILDTNDNELIGISPTGSAVNNIQIANAATGNAPIISTVGGDADVDIEISPKGTGVTIINSDTAVEGVLLEPAQSYGGGPLIDSGARQTVNDTPTPVWTSFAIEVGDVVSITADVVAVETDETNRAVYKIHGLFYRNTAGNVTQQGATVSLNTIETDATWACDFALDIGAQTIEVQVTGAAATINWKCAIDVTITKKA
jgi:hypothetical protein